MINISHIYRFGDPVPGVLQPEDGRVGEGRADLQHAVEVVQTPADVSHGDPLLNHLDAGAHVRLGDNLRDDQPRHLEERTISVFGIK